MLTKLFGVVCLVVAIVFAFLAGGGVVQIANGLIDAKPSLILWEIGSVAVLFTLGILCLWPATKVVVVPQDRESEEGIRFTRYQPGERPDY